MIFFLLLQMSLENDDKRARTRSKSIRGEQQHWAVQTSAPCPFLVPNRLWFFKSRLDSSSHAHCPCPNPTEICLKKPAKDPTTKLYRSLWYLTLILYTQLKENNKQIRKKSPRACFAVGDGNHGSFRSAPGAFIRLALPAALKSHIWECLAEVAHAGEANGPSPGRDGRTNNWLMQRLIVIYFLI